MASKNVQDCFLTSNLIPIRSFILDLRYWMSFYSEPTYMQYAIGDEIECNCCDRGYEQISQVGR